MSVSSKCLVTGIGSGELYAGAYTGGGRGVIAPDCMFYERLNFFLIEIINIINQSVKFIYYKQVL